MWLLPVEIPEEARAALPPGRYLLPWYYTADDVARFAGVARRLLCGIDHELRLPWDAVPVIAKGAPGSLDRTLLVVRIEDAALDTEAIEKGLSELRCRYTLVQVPAPRETGYAWQEQHLKPALVSLLREHVSDPEHPLAPLNIGELPVLLAASLTPDALEMLDLLEAALTHRLRYARYGATESDWWRSVMLSAGRRLAGRLNRLAVEEAGCALEALLGVGGGTGERFEAGAAALEKVGLGRVVAGSLSIGPLGRAIRERPVWGGLVEELEAGVWTPAARRLLTTFSAEDALEPEFIPLDATIVVNSADTSAPADAELPKLAESLVTRDDWQRLVSLDNALSESLDTPGGPPPELRTALASTLVDLRERERSAAPRAQKFFRFMRSYLFFMSALGARDLQWMDRAIVAMEDIVELDPQLLQQLARFVSRAYLLAAATIKSRARARSDFERASQLARKVLAVPERPAEAVLAHLILGDIALFHRDDAGAATEYERALKAGTEANIQVLVQMAAGQVVQLALKQKDTERATEILADNDDLGAMPAVQLALGAQHLANGSFEEAQQHFQTAIARSNEQQALSWLAEAQLNIGRLAMVRGEYKEAQNALSASLQAFEADGNITRQASAHALLGLLSVLLSAHDEAQTHFERALVLAEPLDDHNTLITVYEGLEILAQQRGADEEAARWRERLRGLAPPAPPDSSDPLRGSSGSPSGRS